MFHIGGLPSIPLVDGYSTSDSQNEISHFSQINQLSQMNQLNIQNNSKVKHPPSAFLLFCKDTRDCVRQRCPNLSPVDITRLLSQLWKSLDQTKKQKYFQKRKVMIDRFVVDHPDYNGETSLHLKKMKKQMQNHAKTTNSQLLNPKQIDSAMNSLVSHSPLKAVDSMAVTSCNIPILKNNIMNSKNDASLRNQLVLPTIQSPHQKSHRHEIEDGPIGLNSWLNDSHDNCTTDKASNLTNSALNLTNNQTNLVFTVNQMLLVQNAQSLSASNYTSDSSSNDDLISRMGTTIPEFQPISLERFYKPFTLSENNLNDFLSHFPKETIG
ncbi:hypothetical protein TRFO_35621 [Tritrichomonas foetus]|uniref:HMG box domain-containing protein n=1 Tax=Tritrichomonas foetus TaxID=1144522 RepID=A0A1J4JKG8_9EUKA|nr:hypothetical protein TRFO_35621 [Tritrichomonas foetus]|eukprot:OHS98053.1 hypothetical protein TRFO_35621 [Tritrichomonas foetus]